ncbi:MAG: zinc ribbon domain-containing protein [Defluviitaleaceae bacterium]|nr:zinc ribbon domain-containing protein [Defluviitaleaceae bacterium]
MPYYDLLCKTCQTEHNIRATMAEKTENRIPCPECGSFEMETLFINPPAYIKGGKSRPIPTHAPCPSSGGCGARCPHAG